MKDVTKFVLEFYELDRLSNEVITYSISLIPKVVNQQCIEEFRLICLVGCLYRHIFKLLAVRLKRVIGKLVSFSQITFIVGKQMLDVVLVLSEFLVYTKRKKKKFLVVKIYFEKDYDCMPWGFLRYVLRLIGFGHKHLSRMEATNFSSSLSILVNSSPANDFMACRGLR